MILALDLGNNLGYCYREKRRRTIVFGVCDLSSKEDGGQYGKFEEVLSSFNSICKITKIYYERVDFVSYTYAYRSYAGFLGVLKKFASENNIELHGMPIKRVKKFFTGNGNASKMQMQVKAEEKTNSEILDDNIADAIGIYYTGTHYYG